MLRLPPTSILTFLPDACEPMMLVSAPEVMESFSFVVTALRAAPFPSMAEPSTERLRSLWSS